MPQVTRRYGRDSVSGQFASASTGRHTAPKMSFGERRASLRDAFSAFDTDRSGTLDTNEVASLLAAFGREPGAALSLIEEHDTDHNGVLDFDEFEKLLEAPVPAANEADAAESAKLLSKRMRKAGLTSAKRINLKRLVAENWRTGGVVEAAAGEVTDSAVEQSVEDARAAWKAQLVARTIDMLTVASDNALAVAAAEREYWRGGAGSVASARVGDGRQL